jgi:hypothetical protein
MKRQAYSLISLLSLLLMAGSAIAQTVQVRANIPFNFAVGNKTFPAGTYDLGTISDDTKMLQLRARDGDSSMIVGSNAAENLKPADKTKLVFNQYGDRYFLSQLWIAGETRGRQLPKTSREKEVATELAKDFTQKRVEIVASLY